MWRYEGRRDLHSAQGTFVVLAGSLTIHLGEPPERHVVPASASGILHVTAGTPLQTANDGDGDLVLRLRCTAG